MKGLLFIGLFFGSLIVSIATDTLNAWLILVVGAVVLNVDGNPCLMEPIRAAFDR